MPLDTQLKGELERMDREFGGDEMFRMLGSTLLSYTTTDSSRMYMFTSHVKQVLTLLNPDVPRLSTGFENSIGKYSRAFKRLEGTWEVKDVIKKFPDMEAPGIYTIVIYNKKLDMYDMIEVPVAENLTEKFGFVYNTSRMDQLKPGDKIKDEVIYKSTSFDDQMNYRYGKNARVFYSTSTDTLEDAIVVRKGWAEGVKSVEVDDVLVGVNTNEVLLNLYGDDHHYRAFPDIGEEVKDSLLCAVRQINNEHLLYDFQKKNMQETNDTDAEYFVSKHAVVYDIDIFYNGSDEFPKSIFYQQLRQYFLAGKQYATKMYRWADDIKKSGSKFTENVSYFRSRYMHWNDPDYQWKNKDRAFANMLIRFKVKAVVPLEYGSKLTGRYGNKGVVSSIIDVAHDDDTPDLQSTIGEMLKQSNLSEDEIYRLTSNIQVVDDARMPYTDDGPIDIMMNSSGAVRRLNPGQLCEVEVNFIADEVVKKYLRPAKTLEAKEKVIFKFLNVINPDEATFFRTMLDGYDHTELVGGHEIHFMAPERKKAFIEDVETNGFYLVRPPHHPLLYKDVMALYAAFPEVKPVPMYIDLFGIKHRRIIKDGVCGIQYVVVLKQNSNKNFSARSTFRVNRSNLPAKDVTKKTNRSSYARTPVRLSEIYNLMASISGETLAEYNIFTRSSPIGSKSLDRILSATGNPLKIHKLKVRDNYTNSNADILFARLKSIGLGIEFATEEEMKTQYPPETVVNQSFYGFEILDRWDRHELYQDLFDRFMKYMRRFAMMETHHGEKQELCWKKVFDDVKDIYEISDDTKAMLMAATQPKEQLLSQIKEKSEKLAMPTGKKRGRKPKNREAAALVEAVLEANAADHEEQEENAPHNLIEV